MGKTRDLFKKIREIKETFHARIGVIKERNGKDLTEAEEIKKRWQECTEELYKKGLNYTDTKLFKILKMMLLKCCIQHVSKFGKLSSGHRTGKGPFSFQS